MYKTGYFANEFRVTKVHIVEDNIPICGSKIGKDLNFLWCSNDIAPDYVDCEKCRKVGAKIIIDRMNDLAMKIKSRRN
jgi:hypothetical protein